MFDVLKYAKENKVCIIISPQVTKDGMVSVAHSVLFKDGKATLNAVKTEQVENGNIQMALDTAVARLGRGKAFAIGTAYTSQVMRDREKFFREGKGWSDDN